MLNKNKYKLFKWLRPSEKIELDTETTENPGVDAIEMVADGLRLDETKTRHTEIERQRVAYNQDILAAISEFEEVNNLKYREMCEKAQAGEISSEEFCDFAYNYEYKTAKKYGEILPLLSLDSIRKHRKLLLSKGLGGRISILLGENVIESESGNLVEGFADMIEVTG